MRDAILRLKYGQKRRLAPPLGDFLAEFLARQEDFPRRADAIVPVPLHPSRLRERGFNQSELLALRIVPGLEMPIRTDWLRRIRRTRPQVELDADQRAANVRDAFAVPNGVDLDGTTIILLDDVLTTGHTVQECARALANSGAKAVHVVAVARGAV